MRGTTTLLSAGRTGSRGAWRPLVLLVLLALATVLGACEECGQIPSLPHLKLPNVRLVGTNLGGYPEQHMWVRTIAPQPDSAPEPFAISAGYGYAHAINLASGNAQTIALSQSCFGAPGLTSDGAWLACDGAEGIVVTPFSITTPLTPHLLVPLATNRYDVDVAWAADEHHLAVLFGTTISIYYTVPPYTNAQLIAQLNIANFAGNCDVPRQVCSLRVPVWSPDDAWLAFLQNTTRSVNPIFAVHLAALPQAVLALRATPIALDVPLSAIAFVATTMQLTPPTWIPHTATLTYISQDGRRIVERALPSGAPVTLLNQRQVSLGTLAWSPDGGFLVFSATGLSVGPVIPETTATPTTPVAGSSARQALTLSQALPAPATCASAPPDLYVYTPPAGS